MPNVFAPFDYGQVAGNVEAIRGARTRNALAQQAGQQQQAQFNEQQQQQNTQHLYQALTEISQNPLAAEKLVPELQQRGILRGDFDYRHMTHEQIKKTAGEGAAALGKALGLEAASVNRMGKYNPGDFTPESWSKFVQAGGKDADSAMLVRYEPPSVTKVGGAPSLVTRSGGAGTVTPLSTPQQEAAAAAQLAGSQEGAKLSVQSRVMPKIRSAIKLAEVKAANRGEKLNALGRAQAALPGLQEVTAKLMKLSDIATYTKSGQLFDLAAKELGFGATKGGTARSTMVSIVDNQVLPLLRDTFGAAFTEREGNSLRATLLDPNATPEAKKATLDSFIDQKTRNIETMQREVGGQPQQPATDNDPLGLR